MMAFFRPSRDARSDRFFEIKVALLVAGAGAGLIGMLSERSWLVWAGIAILGVGLLLRLLAARQRPGDHTD